MSKKIDERRKSDGVPHGAITPRWSADRVRKSDRTRRRILEALEGLLQSQGLQELSVNDITAAAGVRRTAFYFYFSSKAVAVAMLLDELYDETLSGAAEFTGRATDRVVALSGAIRHLWDLWQRHRPLMLAVLDARSSDRDAAEIWERWLDRYVAPVAEVVAADREAGLAPAGPEPARMLRLLLSMNERSLERMLRANADPREADDELATLTAIWARAIYGDVPPARARADASAHADGTRPTQ